MDRTIILFFVTLLLNEIHIGCSMNLFGIPNVINNIEKLSCHEIKSKSCTFLNMKPLNMVAIEGINRLAQCLGYNSNVNPKVALNKSNAFKVEISAEIVKVQELNTNLKVCY